MTPGDQSAQAQQPAQSPSNTDPITALQAALADAQARLDACEQVMRAMALTARSHPCVWCGHNNPHAGYCPVGIASSLYNK